MSSRKRQRQQRRKKSESPRTGSGITASRVFIGLIVLFIAIIWLVSARSESPDCPPGQVWSSAHQHCH